MSAPEPLAIEIRALMLKALIGEAGKALADLTKSMSGAYPLPTTVPFESPLDGSKLGYVQRTRTNPEWVVTSLEQLAEHFTREFPAALETVFLIDVPGIAEPVALPEDHPITLALAQVAPELLTPHQRVPAETIAAALQESRDTGQAATPGIQLVRRGQGNLNLVYDKKEAPAAIARLVRSGQVTFAQMLALDPVIEVA